MGLWVDPTLGRGCRCRSRRGAPGRAVREAARVCVTCDMWREAEEKGPAGWCLRGLSVHLFRFCEAGAHLTGLAGGDQTPPQAWAWAKAAAVHRSPGPTHPASPRPQPVPEALPPLQLQPGPVPAPARPEGGRGCERGQPRLTACFTNFNTFRALIHSKSIASGSSEGPRQTTFWKLLVKCCWATAPERHAQARDHPEPPRDKDPIGKSTTSRFWNLL